MVFRKVTAGFGYAWDTRDPAGDRSLTGTANLYGQTAVDTVRPFLGGHFAFA